MRIWLFDLDGVLVYPGGYHAALQATVNQFSRAMGMGDAAPSDAAIELFEASGITSEWDSSAFCLAAIFSEIWRAHPALHLPSDFDAALKSVRAFPRAADWNALYAQWTRRLAPQLSAQRRPPEAALDLFLEDARQFSRDGRSADLESLLTFLFRNTRNFAISPTMRVFQTYTLGSQRFAKHYGIAPAFETPSLLRELDRSALSPANRERILELAATKENVPVIYTLRPCKPRDLDGNPADYPPEAEIALELVGLSGLPMIGFGHLHWLANQRGLTGDLFGKPSPVHALAAIARAIGGTERAALGSARALAEEARLLSPFDALRGEQLAIEVFEDSANGIRGAQTAAQFLERAGIAAHVNAWGVTQSAAKHAALNELGAPVFSDVNQAMEAAFKEKGLDASRN